MNVLEFTAAAHHHVNHGIFWPFGVDLPRVFYWDAWVCPTAEGGYIISEGYGGLHSLLFGFGGLAASAYNPLTGNVWDGTNPALSFGSDDGPIAGEWCHVAIASDGARIVCYLNGVPSGMVLYNQMHRYCQQGTMFIGGSGHSNYGGKIAQVRGFEGINPLTGPFDAANRMLVAFRPETRLSAFAKQRGADGPLTACNFLADYTSPSLTVPDHSPVGYNGSTHPGQLWGTTEAGDGAINDGFGRNVMPSRYPLPRFIVDATAPGAQTDAPPVVPASAPLFAPATPTGALVFDSFSRVDSTFCFDQWPTLGSTESGSLGPKTWQYNAPSSSDGKGDAAYRWGVMKGRAVALGGPGFQCAFVDCGQSNQDARVDRRVYPANYSDGRTGLAVRVQDGNDFWYVAADGASPSAQTIHWGYYSGAQRTSVGSAPAPTIWTTLRVTVNASNQFTIYCDGAQIAQFTDARYAAATKAGLFMDDFGNGFSGLARFDNFTVLPVGVSPPPPPPPPPSGNAAIRLRADEITGMANNAPLAAWTDALGNSAAQSDAIRRPLYKSTPSVHFDGINDRLDIASLNWPPEFTVFVVCSKPLITPAQPLSSDTGARRICGITIGQDFPNQVSFLAFNADGLAFRANHTGANPVRMILSFVRGASSVEGWVNGQSDGPTLTSGTPNSGANPLTLGEIGYGFFLYDGDIEEVVVFFSALSDTERQAEETSLNLRHMVY